MLSFSGYSIYFGDNSGSSNWESGDYINNLRLHVKDGTAKLYINDELLGKKELDNPDTAYTKLIINGIKEDDPLFEVTVPDHTFSLAPVISEFDFDPDSGYQKNDTLGEYLVVKEDSYAEKYVAGTGADRLGRLEFCSLNLSGAFEVIMNADLQTSYTQKILLKAGDSELDQLVLSFSGYSIYFGDNSGSSNWKGGYINNLRFHVKDGTAKLYINDLFMGKKELDNPDTAYTKLIINGIKKDDRLFEVTVPDHSFALATPTSGFDFTFSASSYEVGDVFGQDLVVKQTDYGQQYITGNSADVLGSLEHSVDLSNDFEAIINADFQTSYAQKIFLKAGDSELDQLVLSFSGYSIYFGDNSGSSNWKGGYINNLRFHVKDGTAKLYINDHFFGKKELDNPDTVYTKLIISGVKKDDRIFEIKAGKGTSGSTPGETEYECDMDGDGKLSLGDIIYGLQVLAGVR